MSEQSRRSFLQLVGGAAASIAAIAKVDAARVHTYVNQPSPGSPQVAELAQRAEAEALARPHPFAGADLLTLLNARGLMTPCLNCYERGTSWLPHGAGRIQCSGCGWIDERLNYEIPCPCRACRDWRAAGWRQGVISAKGDPFEVDLATLMQRAEPGFYRIVAPVTKTPVTKYELNAYHPNTDGYLHRVTSRLVARVACAVHVAKYYSNETYGGGLERGYQANGNIVLKAWEMIDCHEWQRDGRPNWAPVLT